MEETQDIRDELINPPAEIEDPERRLERMKNTALEASEDLIPVLMEKAINGKTKDALHVFTELSDRAGFVSQAPQNNPQNQPLINLNIQASDIGNMLGGLKTITQTPPEQIGQEVQNAEKDE